jgi:PhnB protein
MIVQPYLNFAGRCEEALEFYRKALGAEIVGKMRFKEAPDQSMCTPATGEKIMHSCFKVGDTQIMASDGRCEGNATFHGIALTVTADNDAQAVKVFNALSEGGQVNMPLTKTFFSSNFGMLADRFGVGWMVIVKPQ